MFYAFVRRGPMRNPIEGSWFVKEIGPGYFEPRSMLVFGQN
jgi:hypothetical protein